jgi:hypothetical protein
MSKGRAGWEVLTCFHSFSLIQKALMQFLKLFIESPWLTWKYIIYSGESFIYVYFFYFYNPRSKSHCSWEISNDFFVSILKEVPFLLNIN